LSIFAVPRPVFAGCEVPQATVPSTTTKVSLCISPTIVRLLRHFNASGGASVLCARMLRLVVPFALVLTGCASHYSYTFRVTDPGVQAAPAPGTPDVIGDADLLAEILVDTKADAIQLGLTNKTDQVLQVDWANIALSRPGGGQTLLRPDTDLGWIAPGAHVVARLFPFALPHKGHAAEANNDQAFSLAVPTIVRREAKLYHYTLVAHVRED
jgi:hypothetical protein